jgi:hypothetical protein
MTITFSKRLHDGVRQWQEEENDESRRVVMNKCAARNLTFFASKNPVTLKKI